MVEKRESVLIVDDQLNWREVLSGLLESEYAITCAVGYGQALNVLVERQEQRKEPFALAILDIRLEDSHHENEDGMVLCEKLRELSAPTRVIILTGCPSYRTAKKALQSLQATDYVLKQPEDGSDFSIADFRQSVRHAVEAFRMRQKCLPVQRRALIAEDESNWQGILAGVLTQYDYSVDMAGEINEVIEKVKTQSYNLMIIDPKLGRSSLQDGVELLAKIREHDQNAEVIVISGCSASEQVRAAFAKYRVCDFLTKYDFDRHELQSTIRRAEERASALGSVSARDAISRVDAPLSRK